MEKEDVTLVAQLLTGIKDAIDKLQEALKRKDLDKINAAKKEIINFHDQIDKII